MNKRLDVYRETDYYMRGSEGLAKYARGFWSDLNVMSLGDN